MRRAHTLAITLLLCAAACDPQGDHDGRAGTIDDEAPSLVAAVDDVDVDEDADAPSPTAEVPLASPLDPFGEGGTTCVKYGTTGTGTIKSSACKSGGATYTIPDEWIENADNQTYETARTSCANSGHADGPGGVERCASVCSGVGKVQFTGVGPDTCVDDVAFAVGTPWLKQVSTATCAAGLGQWRYEATTTASCGCRCQ